MKDVVFGCPQCGRGVEVGVPGTARCPRCDHEVMLADAPDALGGCLACGCSELYRHRDFNVKLGLFLIALAAVLCIVLTSFLPLLVAAVIDLLLYVSLPDVAICYRCKAHHRGFSNVHALAAFDLERHEHYRFEKARGDEPKKDGPAED